MSGGDITATLVELALAEDVGPGDRTTEWTVPPEARREPHASSRGENPARRDALAGDRASKPPASAIPGGILPQG